MLAPVQALELVFALALMISKGVVAVVVVVGDLATTSLVGLEDDINGRQGKAHNTCYTEYP
jgi:hypothetical protein